MQTIWCGRAIGAPMRFLPRGLTSPPRTRRRTSGSIRAMPPPPKKASSKSTTRSDTSTYQPSGMSGSRTAGVSEPNGPTLINSTSSPGGSGFSQVCLDHRTDVIDLADQRCHRRAGRERTDADGTDGHRCGSQPDGYGQTVDAQLVLLVVDGKPVAAGGSQGDDQRPDRGQ